MRDAPDNRVPDALPGARVIDELAGGVRRVVGLFVPTAIATSWESATAHAQRLGLDPVAAASRMGDGEYARCWLVWLRPATHAEALPLLRADDREERRVNLTAQLATLLAAAVPTTPLDADAATRLAALPEVPVRGISAGETRTLSAALRVDEANNVVWHLRAATGGGWQATRHELTPDWRKLIGELTATYTGVDEMEAARVPRRAAEVLAGLGWSALDAVAARAYIRLDSSRDASALARRSAAAWRQAGWLHPDPAPPHPPSGLLPSPAQAERIADAGISAAAAHALHQDGQAWEAIPALAPPLLPDAGPARIIIRRPVADGVETIVTDNPERARALCAKHPEIRAAHVTVHAGAGLLHSERRWQIWDDGARTLSDRFDGAHLSTLHPAAVTALDLVFGAANTDSQLCERPIWHILTKAIGYQQHGRSAHLRRHTFTLDGHAKATIVIYSTHPGAGDTYHIHTNEKSARRHRDELRRYG